MQDCSAADHWWCLAPCAHLSLGHGGVGEAGKLLHALIALPHGLRHLEGQALLPESQVLSGHKACRGEGSRLSAVVWVLHGLFWSLSGHNACRAHHIHCWVSLVLRMQATEMCSGYAAGNSLQSQQGRLWGQEACSAAAMQWPKSCWRRQGWVSIEAVWSQGSAAHLTERC